MTKEEFNNIVLEVEDFIETMTYQRDRWDLRRN